MKLVIANVILMVAMLGVGLYYYSILPPKVPVHFGSNGKPDRFGDKSELLILPILFSSVPLIAVVLFKFRYRIWRYLSIGIDLEKLDEEMRRRVVDEYFKLILSFFVFLSLFLLLLEITSFESSLKGELVWWFYPDLILVVILIIPYLIFYSKFVERWQKI